MRRLVSTPLLTKRELDRFLEATLARLRWATIAVVLAIAFLPTDLPSGRVPDWALVVGFGAYNLLLAVLPKHPSGRRSVALGALLDLAAVGLAYAASAQPGGPLFGLAVLAAAQTAAFMTPVGSVLYTAAVAAIVGGVEPTLSGWGGDAADLRALLTRLAVLGVVGVGGSALAQRLELERKAGQAMAHEAERLDDLDRLRAEFVATVSHDLRTPLTAARAGLGMLETSALPRLRADEAGLLANGRRNVERLGLLIDDLLAFNELEAGTLRLEPEPLDLRAVVTDAMAAVHPLLEAKRQPLELDLPVPLPVRGDAGRLELVVLNALANAHRHTPAGTRITVAGRLDGDEVRVAIRDRGPGIPEAELEAVFARFHRLAAATSGSGLGLAIARGIVELHGGRMWAESRPGEGVTFHVALPAHLEEGRG